MTVVEKIKAKLRSWWPPWPFNCYGPWKKPPEEKKPFSWQAELREWAIAFVVVAIVYFILLPALLGTSMPLVVVSSCSEKGHLNVGDVLVLQGVAIEDVNAPEVYINKFTGFSPIYSSEGTGEVIGAVIGNDTVALNRSSDIIVYTAWPSGKQIIHRVFVKVKTDNGHLLLTKGDANNILDQMSTAGGVCVTENPGSCLSTPVTERTLIGRGALNIPLLGHVKLFFCDITLGLFCEGHANAGTGYQYVLNC